MHRLCLCTMMENRRVMKPSLANCCVFFDLAISTLLFLSRKFGVEKRYTMGIANVGGITKDARDIALSNISRIPGGSVMERCTRVAALAKAQGPPRERDRTSECSDPWEVKSWNEFPGWNFETARQRKACEKDGWLWSREHEAHGLY